MPVADGYPATAAMVMATGRRWESGAAGAAHRLAPVSVLGVILIVVGALLLLLLVGGLIASRRYRAAHDAEITSNIAAADRALEQARAADRGWDRAALEAAAHDAIRGARPDWTYDDLALVLVDDRPGVEQDRAHFLASGGGDQARVILARTDSGWALERID